MYVDEEEVIYVPARQPYIHQDWGGSHVTIEMPDDSVLVSQGEITVSQV